jgi:hypothetical protein
VLVASRCKSGIFDGKALEKSNLAVLQMMCRSRWEYCRMDIGCVNFGCFGGGFVNRDGGLMKFG